MDTRPQDSAPAPPAETSDAMNTDTNPPPAPPVPSDDPSLAVDAAAQQSPPVDEQDLFKLRGVEALRLLSASIELLVRMTGDIPPTPPPRMPTDPQMSGLQAEKENIVRSHSEKNLARLRQQQQQQQQPKTEESQCAPVTGKRPCDETRESGKTKLQAYSAAMSAKLASQAGGAPAEGNRPGEIDGVVLKPQPHGLAASSPPTVSSSPSPYIIVGSDSQPINLQHGAITRKFYSKNEPPISINQYLLRLHQFCPMSAAVYLATSLYIHRLAVEERAIPVTRRNAHRLVLAGLRVAMKALEDLSYPHAKFAKVGGVSPTELARLEISFCFLAGFELVVHEETLRDHWMVLRDGNAAQTLQSMEIPALRLDRKPREVAA